MSSFDIQEILEVMDIANNGNFERVLLMAQGVKASELADATRWLRGVARTLGCKVTERNHIYWYGNERRT
jgi:ribosomal protein L11